MQRSEHIAKRLAEQRAQICLIGLKEIQKYWEVNNLVLELFFQYLDDSTAKKLRGGVADDLPEEQLNQQPGSDTGPIIEKSSATPISARVNPVLTTDTGFDLLDNTVSSLSLGQSQQGSMWLDMPRNILSHGGSAEDFSCFLDPYWLSSNGVGDTIDTLP